MSTVTFLLLALGAAFLGFMVWFLFYRDPHSHDLTHHDGHHHGHGRGHGGRHGHVEEVSETITVHRRMDGEHVDEEVCICKRTRYPRFMHFIPGLEHGGLAALVMWFAFGAAATLGTTWWFGLIKIGSLT